MISRLNGWAATAMGVVARALSAWPQATRWLALLLMAALPSVARAIHPDAEYLAREKQFGKLWQLKTSKSRKNWRRLSRG